MELEWSELFIVTEIAVIIEFGRRNEKQGRVHTIPNYDCRKSKYYIMYKVDKLRHRNAYYFVK